MLPRSLFQKMGRGAGIRKGREGGVKGENVHPHTKGRPSNRSRFRHYHSSENGSGASRARMFNRTQRSDTQICHLFVMIIFRKWEGELDSSERGGGVKMFTCTQRSDTQIGHFSSRSPFGKWEGELDLNGRRGENVRPHIKE